MAEKTRKQIHDEIAEGLDACIAEAEAQYRAQIEDLAEKILLRKTRVVLLAGPSSSGKTTTANLLADTLRREGHAATVISLDDFYRPQDDPGYPRNAAGDLDFETPDALDIPLIRETIRRIVRKEPVPLPHFDFKVGRRFDNAVVTEIPDGGCAIIEGLHALNPRLVDGLGKTSIARVFVSVSTNINDDDGNRILSGRKIRFIRRLTRDYLYRASDAKRTLSLWQGVQEGESRYLYPYKETAEFRFDTFHTYEVGLMRPFAERVLDGSPDLDDEYLAKIRYALSRFDVVPLDKVPAASLLREFVPGGIYESLY